MPEETIVRTEEIRKIIELTKTSENPHSCYLTIQKDGTIKGGWLFSRTDVAPRPESMVLVDATIQSEETLFYTICMLIRNMPGHDVRGELPWRKK